MRARSRPASASASSSPARSPREPRLLLLDEVTGGVDQRSIPGLVQLVRDLHAGGLTLLVIEHNMRVDHRGRPAHRRAATWAR